MFDVGEVVLVRYRGVLEDGTEFVRSGFDDEPTKLIIGSHQMLTAFENAVAQMNVGEHRVIHIPANQAYGAYDDSLVFRIPHDLLPKDTPISKEGIVFITTPLGKVPARISSMASTTVVVDGNHELAGHDLDFEVEVLGAVRESAIERELHPVECGCGCNRLKESLLR